MELKEAMEYVEKKAMRLADRRYPDPIIWGLVLSQLAGIVELSVGVRETNADVVKNMIGRMRDNGPMARDQFIEAITVLSVPDFKTMIDYWDET